jgi:hypothetical protein
VGDACFKPFITIKSHNLHASEIRKIAIEIAFYHERGTSSLPSLVPRGCVSFGPSLLTSVQWFQPSSFLIGFCCLNEVL